MTAAVARLSVSPYARRIARDRQIDLTALSGTGPAGRIVAADILAWRAPAPQSRAPRPAPVLTFTTPVSLAPFARLANSAARVGLAIALDDAALRAARHALAARPGGIAIETDGRQILVEAPAGLSIGAERRLRLAALDHSDDASTQPAAASLLILPATRVTPVSLPLLPGRALRFVLAIDRSGESAQALLCANGDALTAAQAAAILDTFAAALEEPLALLA